MFQITIYESLIVIKRQQSDVKFHLCRINSLFQLSEYKFNILVQLKLAYVHIIWSSYRAALIGFTA